MLTIFVSEPSHDRTKIKTNRGPQNLRQLGNYNGDLNTGHSVNGTIRLTDFTIVGKKSVNL